MLKLVSRMTNKFVDNVLPEDFHPDWVHQMSRPHQTGCVVSKFGDDPPRLFRHPAHKGEKRPQLGNSCRITHKKEETEK